ncbi:MAG: ABC transporter ATP-binding protein [Armatimonadetes bacterium]|nr:ABC transporter ATP-binding protein [Armatimonadota bacterium]MDE2207575.1 ABC transporter ATP-binding protein [Armatimonadota bacterium]
MTVVSAQPTQDESPAQPPLLQVAGLCTDFHSPGGVVHAVRDVSFQLERGQILGIVGESGSGKSATALSLMGLIPSPPGVVTAGSIRLDGQELLQLGRRAWQAVRGARMAMVFQDPFSSLNPTMTLGAQVAEPILLHTGASREEARERVLRLFHRVRIASPEVQYNQYPHQVSGGQRQRVMIAMAFSCSPELLIADEPTTALDVTVQAQVLSLMAELQQESGTGILLITHDLGVVAEICDRVLVMYAGEIVESGPVNEILSNPRHPYTQGLLQSLPSLHAGERTSLRGIPGQPPDLANLPSGCPFHPRCPHAIPGKCSNTAPPLTGSIDTHSSRCWLQVQDADG